MGDGGADNADGPVGFLRIPVLIGIVGGALIAVTKTLGDVAHGDFFLRFDEDRVQAVFRSVFQSGIDAEQLPDPGVVVGLVVFDVPDVGPKEVERPALGIVQAVGGGERDKPRRGHDIHRILHVCGLESSLVGGDEKTIVGDALGEPVMAAGGLEVPGFPAVHKGHPESLPGPRLLHVLAQEPYALPGRGGVRQNDGGYGILDQALLHIIGVRLQGRRAVEDGLRGRHRHAVGVDPRFFVGVVGLGLGLPIGEGGVGQGVLREGTGEGVVVVVADGV